MRATRPTRRIFAARRGLGGLALTLALLGVASVFLAIVSAYPFLAQHDPVGRGVLVIEGWMREPALRRAARAAAEGDYDLYVTTGGVLDWASYIGFDTQADLAADVLRAEGLPADRVVSAPSPHVPIHRTYHAALAARRALEERQHVMRSLDVYSEGPHARRSRSAYARAFGDAVVVGVISASPVDYRPEAWWHTSSGAKSVITEAIGWVWWKINPPDPPREASPDEGPRAPKVS